MKKRDAWWLFAFLAGYVVLHKRAEPEPEDPPAPPDDDDIDEEIDMPSSSLVWSHPMPALLVDGTRRYLPKVSDTYSATKTTNPPHRRHIGVDNMYERRWPWKKDTPTLRFKGRETSKNGQYFFPFNVPIRTAADGTVWSVTHSAGRGIGVLVVHQRGQLATWYQHLDELADDWKRGDKLPRGTVLGTQGFAPDGDAPIHQHFGFKVWDKAAKKFRWVDPEPILLGWPVTFELVV